MIGRFLFGLAFVEINLHQRKVELLVDTGFNGSIMLPKELIEELGLPSIGYAEYALADGNYAETEIFKGEMECFGRKKEIAVLSADSDFSLLGMELLENARLILEPSKEIVSIEEST